MKPLATFIILLLAFTFVSCTSNKNDNVRPVLSCVDNMNGLVIGSWSNPEFIANGHNCYLNACVDLSIELESSSFYRLDYTVLDTQTNTVLREVNLDGYFTFNCTEREYLSGHYSALSTARGELIMESDSIPPAIWDVEKNGVLGLIIYPENLGLSHNVYITLDRN